EGNAHGLGARTVSDRRTGRAEGDGERLPIEECSNTSDVPAIENLLREQIIPEPAAVRDSITEVHIHGLKAVARDILIQLVGSPLIPGVVKSFGPGVVTADLEAAAETFVDLYLQSVV